MEERRKGIFYRLYLGMNDSKWLLCIRSSLIMLIPVLVIGSMALMFKSLPIEGYQLFIQGFAGGLIAKFFSLIYMATYEVLSLYVVVSVSICYTQKITTYNKYALGPLVSSSIAFVILSGTLSDGSINIQNWNAAGMFTAVVSSLVASFLYDVIHQKMRKTIRLLTEGDDETFRNTLSTLLPTVIVVIIMASFNALVLFCFDGKTLQEVFNYSLTQLFSGMGRNTWTVLLFEFLAQLMWFFGIHGNNVLESVCQNIFVPAIEINQGLIAEGAAATEIYSKTFLDVFVNMGGSGSVMCLLIALMVFSKRRSNKKLARIASIPAFFNISEMITFGLPIVFNPIFIIPYLLTPIVIVLTSTLAVKIGLVPVAINHVEWTTPILWSGYLATGSVAGSILQIANLVIGTLIYAPFVKMFDVQMMRNADSKMDSLIEMIKRCEETREPIQVLSLRGDSGMVARHLAEDLETQLIDRKPIMYYQPQYNHEGECIGAEALLRWKHSAYGMIYPPLVIQVAEESGKLISLEKIFSQPLWKVCQGFWRPLETRPRFPSMLPVQRFNPRNLRIS